MSTRKPYRPISKKKRLAHVVCKDCGRVHYHRRNFGPCDCGRDQVDYGIGMLFRVEVDSDGWKHTERRCFPPPERGARCRCGYAWLRDPKGSWSVASYSSADDPRRRLTHTAAGCWEPCD